MPRKKAVKPAADAFAFPDVESTPVAPFKPGLFKSHPVGAGATVEKTESFSVRGKLASAIESLDFKDEPLEPPPGKENSPEPEWMHTLCETLRIVRPFGAKSVIIQVKGKRIEVRL